MQAHVKTPHIKIDIDGDIPPQLFNVLKDMYGKKVEIIENEEDEYVDAFENDWFENVEKSKKPGDAIRIYRENKDLTQLELGVKLGGISRQNISHMERGTRTISLKTAVKLSKLFNVPLEYFVDYD